MGLLYGDLLPVAAGVSVLPLMIKVERMAADFAGQEDSVGAPPMQLFKLLAEGDRYAVRQALEEAGGTWTDHRLTSA